MLKRCKEIIKSECSPLVFAEKEIDPPKNDVNNESVSKHKIEQPFSNQWSNPTVNWRYRKSEVVKPSVPQTNWRDSCIDKTPLHHNSYVNQNFMHAGGSKPLVENQKAFNNRPKIYSKSSESWTHRPSKQTSKNSSSFHSSFGNRQSNREYFSPRFPRRSLFNSLEQPDQEIVIQISEVDGTVQEELRIKPGTLRCTERKLLALESLIPFPDEKSKTISYGAKAVRAVVRCCLSNKYCLMNCETAVEIYAAATLYGLKDLQGVCQEWLRLQELCPENINELAPAAKCFNALEAFKMCTHYEAMEKVIFDHKCVPLLRKSCVISCVNYQKPFELKIPLSYTKESRSIGSMLETDLLNTLTIKALKNASLSGLEIQIESVGKNRMLNIFVDAEKNNYEEEFHHNLQKTMKIFFNKKLIIAAGETEALNVRIDDIYLCACYFLNAEKVVTQEDLQIQITSNKKNQDKNSLVVISKLIYTVEKN